MHEIIIYSLIVVGVLLLGANWFFRNTSVPLPKMLGRPELLTGIRLSRGDWLIVLKDGRKFRGDCTVWNEYPSGVSASTELESELYDMWQRLKWQAEDNG